MAFVRVEDVAPSNGGQSTDASVAFNGEHAVFIGVQATLARQSADPGQGCFAGCFRNSERICRHR